MSFRRFCQGQTFGNRAFTDFAAEVGGTGGGRPEMAQAGGKDSSKLDASLEKVFGLVEHALQR